VQEAKTLGIPVGALDKLVRQAQARAADRSAELPHWHVEPWSDPVDGDAFLDSLRRVFRRYIVLPQGADIALALWVLHAWTYDAGDISPFLVLVSPTKRCGKTSVLIILYFLTPRSELSANITASVLFRYIEATRPTLLIDEADSFVKDNEELRGILNSGHTKTAASVIRNVEINGEHKPQRFSTWAPKAIATIQKLADTLEDRAVIVTLQRKARDAKVERLRRRDSDEFADQRRQAARWAADNFERLKDPNPLVPEALNDRAADNWRPLLAIADLAGGEWPQRAREAARLLSGEGHDAASLNVLLLGDCQSAFGDETVIRSADLVAKLAADPERPWAEYNRGKPITQRQLAKLLGGFRIISDTVHPPSLPQGKGYQRAHFEWAWEAYCSGQDTPSGQRGPSQAYKRTSADETATTNDFSSVQKGEAYGSKNGNLAYSHAGLDVCTFQNVESGGEGDSATSDGLDIPACLLRTPNGSPAEGQPPAQALARVSIREVWPPALGPPGDDVFDISPPGRGGHERRGLHPTTTPKCNLIFVQDRTLHKKR
jgi:putative DNA primase/helicase